MSRSDIPVHQRTDFNLVVDEFQNLASDSFAGILSEARKYRLSLTLSHQFMTQLPERMRDAVLGNIGTIVCFRVGSLDAAILEREFDNKFVTSEFTGLGNHEVVVKLLSGGHYTEPFRGKTLPPLESKFSRQKTIFFRSREKYGTRKKDVEEKIFRWLG
jgi:hypothetical protein